MLNSRTKFGVECGFGANLVRLRVNSRSSKLSREVEVEHKNEGTEQKKTAKVQVSDWRAVRGQ